MARSCQPLHVHPEHVFLPVNAIPRLNAAEILRRHGLRPNRGLGQNFLEDPDLLQMIANAADIQPADTVLEIGCGLGHLTRYLASAAAGVTAVELDQRLASIARRLLKTYPNVQIVSGDILRLAPAELGLPPNYLVAANIPYNITSPIIRHLLESESKPRRIVLTVQQEVAERVCARPPRMSILALSVQVYGAATLIARIPASAFYPAPKVDSAVVRIEIYEQPRISPALLPAFFALVRVAFSQKRKTLRNNLSAGLRLGPTRAQDILRAAGIDPGLRAEALGFEDWERLCELPGLMAVLSPARSQDET